MIRWLILSLRDVRLIMESVPVIMKVEINTVLVQIIERMMYVIVVYT